MLSDPADDAESILTAVVNNGSGDVLLKAFATDATEPGITLIPGGTWHFVNFIAVNSAVGVSNLFIRVYKRDTGGTETELFNLLSAEINNTSVEEHEIDTVQPDFPLAATDILVIKYYARSTSVPNRTVTLYYEGNTHYTHIHTPIISGSGGSGSGDMLKAVYDTDNDGKVNEAETVPWAGITDVPSTFPFADHDHSGDAGDGGQYPVTNLTSGTELIGHVVAADGAGGLVFSEPSSKDDLVHYIDGALEIVSDICAFVITRSVPLGNVYLYVFESGSASSIIVDIHKNGVTIFTDQDNRPELPFDSASNLAVSGAPDITNVTIGDVLTVHIDQVATGSEGLCVVISLSAATAGPSATNSIYPQRAVMWHEEVNIVSGNALGVESWSYDVNQDYIYCPLQHPDANGDTFTQSFMIAAGTYDLYILGAGDSNNGLVDWYVDDVLIASGQDWYTAGPTYNIVKTVTDVVITGNGRHVLKGIINGKNVSSTEYYLPLSKYWFEPANDTTSV